MNKKEIDASIENILELIGLTQEQHKLSKELSGGMKRRLSIGIALVGDPKVGSYDYELHMCHLFFRF